VDFWIESVGRKQLYTEKLLAYVLRSRGHNQVAAGTHGAVLLVSLCDVTEVMRLERIRQQYPGNRLLAGGHFAKIGAGVMGLFADAVWIGHCFEMAACKNFAEICEHRSCYVPGETEGLVYASTRIDWNLCPLIQVDRKRFYIFAGDGCRRKCRFCLTSNTEIYRERPGIDMLIHGARHRLGGGMTIKAISNAYNIDIGDDMVQDMLLTDLLRIRRPCSGKLIRSGVEFATDATRKMYGKPLKAGQIREAIARAAVIGAKLHLFHIGGLDPIEDWLQYLDDVIQPGDKLSPPVFFKWTNLEYQQKTPLWRKIRDINFDNYLTADFTSMFFQRGAHKNKRVRVMPVKYPAHAVWRMCMSNVTDIDQYQRVKREQHNKDMDDLVRLYYELEPYKTDLSWIVVGPKEGRAV